MKKLFSTLLLLVMALRAVALDPFDDRYSLHWTANGHHYEHNMTMVGIVQIDGVEQRLSSLEVGAFCDDECRGSVMLQYLPNYDKYLAFLTVGGDDGNTIRFKLYDHAEGYEIEKVTPALTFVTDTICGNPGEPYVFDFTDYMTITTQVYPSNTGTVSGDGDYLTGELCSLTATPYDGYVFMYWTEDEETVSTDPNYTFEVSNSRILTAVFCQPLPELHIHSISHSDFAAGEEVTISWTVYNDGVLGTNGSWYDRVWLSVENNVSSAENDVYLLGTFDNLAALEPGESYTQTQTVTVPESISGTYYLFVITDAYEAYDIEWEDGVTPIPYNPPPYLFATTGYYYSSYYDSKIFEMSEFIRGYDYHDNFFYEVVDVAIPPLPDLQVTAITAPSNFYSGTSVSVTATIANLGEAPTKVDNWQDALYISNSSTFDPDNCILLTRQSHYGYLVNGNSYQVTFNGTVPLDLYGTAYFYVQTDYNGEVYEHVLNNNNITRSDAVNVILTPPADLVPYLNSYSQVASTGAKFDFSFTVANQGAGDPDHSNWWDDVYLSTHEDGMGDDAVLISSEYHYRGLEPDGEYTVTKSVTLPSTLQSGTYFIYVFTDATDEVFEYVYNENNIVKGGTPITLGVPDLQVLQLNAPDTLTACYPGSINYVLKNIGDGAIANWSVTDLIGLSTQANLTNPVSISSKQNTLNIQPDETMTVNLNEVVPNVTEGTYYLFVKADYENALIEPNESNNTLRKYPVFVAHQPLSDLQPLNLTLPATINAGNDIIIEFDVTNLGELDLLDVNCNMALYATNGIDSILCPVQSQTLPLGYPNVSIPVDETIHFVRTVSVTSWVTSEYTQFLLVVDPENQVVEFDETNNAVSQYATVINCPLPDLQVTSVSTPSSIQSGMANTFIFNVVNVGDAALESANLSFALRAYEGDDTIVCPIQTAVFENISMAVNGNQVFTVDAFIPPMLTQNYSYFEIVVDPDEDIHESNHANNTMTFNGTVANYPFDLEVVSMEVPTAILAGRTYTISWTVKNSGTCPSVTIPMYVNNNGQYVAVNETTYLVAVVLSGHHSQLVPWADRIYVSDDDLVDEDDLELLSIDHSMVLNPNNTYTVSQSFVMPYDMAGTKYVIAVSDANFKTYDSNRSNNQYAQSVSVDYGPLPDLRITDVDVASSLTSGKSYMIHYTVVNEGTSATLVDAWTDAFYLGTMEGVTDNASVLGSKVHHGVLPVGASYTDSIQLAVPNRIQGDYYFMSFTDATNQVFEADDEEEDNLLSASVVVMTPLPCDLVAVELNHPTTAQSGEEVQFSWVISNTGANMASGYIRDAVYLSDDAEWSGDDIMLGTVENYINIPANGILSQQVTVPIQGVTEGNYYVIVRTNIQRVLNEITYDNNTIVSIEPMTVTYPVLAIGSSVDQTMTDGQYLYYRIEVGEEFAGQTLSCRLTTNSNMALNKLYLSHNDVPTLSSFDYGAAIPFEQELEILIPALNVGSYYLLATGTQSGGAPQSVNIAASIIHFEILHVDTDHGSNAGSVTSQVLGAKFDSIMDFRLVQGNQYLPAEKVFFTNSTESYVTFNLKDMPAGNYGMAAELPGGIITIKDEAFVIEEGMPAELAVNIVAPSSVRTGSKFTFSVEYGNYGSTDLNVSGFLVESNYPIALQSDSLVLEQHELTFMIASDGGNPDVIRPGHLGTQNIFIYAPVEGSISIRVYAIRRQY